MKTLTLPDFLFNGLLGLHAPAVAQIVSRRQRMEARLAGATVVKGGLAEVFAPFFNQRRPVTIADGIARIHVHDVLGSDTTELDRAFGMTDYAILSEELSTAAANGDVRGIQLDVNSPGGTVVGCPETARLVEEVRARKPVAVHIGVMGCSCAYFLAAAANVITVAPSALVGSVGTILTFYDLAGMLEQLGVAPHIFTPKAADLKATCTEDRAPTEAESGFLQQTVETAYADFSGWVAAHRPRVGAASMRGQWFTGNEAVGNGLADYAGTIEDSLASLRALIG
jgi:signal peptide peptidase SppA